MGENPAVNRHFLFLCAALVVLASALNVSAQGTVFTYQGRLNDNGNPANGAYDLRFEIFDAAVSGSTIGQPQTNRAVPVSSGIFTTNLDFGAVFTGSRYWLSIGVRTNGNVGAFTLLAPRQQLTPVPYAIFANTASNLIGAVSATQLTGTLPSAQVSGNYLGSVNFTNTTNSFTGKYFGNGAGLTNLNGSMIATGTVADARLSANVALLNTNQTFTGTNTFNGTGVFTGANTFTGVNNFTNRGNTFTGSFFGNGLVGWISVLGATTQAVANAGYLLLNTNVSTVTLPLSSSMLVGDLVRIAGTGPAGWFAKPNAGQTIRGNLASYGNSLEVATPNLGNYLDVAASADGHRVYLVGAGISGVFASSDFGRTFATVNGLPGLGQSVACSADGHIVYAVPSGGGTIMVSVDSGGTWASTGFMGTSVSCTANGNFIFISNNQTCSGNGVFLGRLISGAISISTNAAASWTPITGPAGTVTCLAVSGDCLRMVAGVNSGLLYCSANQGATWTAVNNTNLFWTGAYMSADGSRFAATASTVGGVNGGIYHYKVNVQPGVVCTSSVSGSQDATVDLQYLGNNQFMPISGVGTVWGN